MKRFPYLPSTISSLLFLAAILFVSAMENAANAQVSPSLAVYPERIDLAVSRGEVREELLRITNLSDVVMPVRLRVVRWEAADEVGGINFLESAEDISFDIIQWIALPSADIILEPGEMRRIPITISAPQNAEPGGKYGAIFVEPAFPEFYFEEGAARVLPRLGILVLLDIPLLELDAEARSLASVEELSVAGRARALSEIVSRAASLFRAPLSAFAADPAVSVDILTAKPLEIVVRIKNEGISHVRPAGTLTIHNTFGAKVAEAEVPQTTILPGKVRRFPVAFEHKDVPLLPSFLERQLALGRYRATLVLSGVAAPAQGGASVDPLVKTLSYWVFPWQGLLVLLLVLGPLVFVVWHFRKRFRLAFLVLLEGGKAALKRRNREKSKM